MGSLHEEPALALIKQLIAEGELHGAITYSKPTSSAPILRFTSTTIHSASISPTATETEIHARLSAEVQRVKELADLVALADAKLMMSKEYISSMKNMKMDDESDSRGGRRGGGGSQPSHIKGLEFINVDPLEEDDVDFEDDGRGMQTDPRDLAVDEDLMALEG
jgi:hypothetical protein